VTVRTLESTVINWPPRYHPTCIAVRGLFGCVPPTYAPPLASQLHSQYQAALISTKACGNREPASYPSPKP
jgi:hypothetical protein